MVYGKRSAPCSRLGLGNAALWEKTLHDHLSTDTGQSLDGKPFFCLAIQRDNWKNFPIPLLKSALRLFIHAYLAETSC